MLAVPVLLVFALLALARANGRSVPRGWRLERSSSLVVTAVGVAAAGVLLEALFRAARLSGLYWFDGWSFWIPKAKAIYFFGGLDEQVFTTAAGPTYPPVVPILDAAAFHAMGGADTVTLHVQFWFFVTGAVAAVACVLHRHVPAWLLWPSVVLVLALPRFGEHLFVPQADVLVDLLLVLWLRDEDTWRLIVATLLLAGATLTKREGLLFAAAALGVALAVYGRRRAVWQPLVAAAIAVFALAIPWRLWYRSQGIGGEAPTDAGLGGSLDRALDSLRLSADVLFDTTLWSVVPVVALVALAAALVWGDRRLAAFLGSLLAVVFVGGAWVTYSYVDVPITAEESVNPIVRYTGAIVLLAAVSTPLLLASAWRRDTERES